MKLSETALTVLSAAAQQEDRLVRRRPSAPPVVDLNVCRALLKQGLVEIIHAPAEAEGLVTVRDDDGPMAFIISDAGFRALNLEPPESAGLTEQALTGTQAGSSAERLSGPEPTTLVADRLPEARTVRGTIQDAAAAVLAAWDDEANRGSEVMSALEAPMADLRGMLAGRPHRAAGAPRKPREGTKQEAVLNLLLRTDGTTIAQVMDATGWASHTARGFFAGLKKKGVPVAVLERIRQVGPDKQGAKGSYTIYHIAAAG